ncbi:hypothetical protein [Micromonospora sp. NBC_00421]|uniref:hypothetical protein n=1 Tax=Micromonospora sp. NBC_00421 TaxID=2975976 RepID=UPI002E247635
MHQTHSTNEVHALPYADAAQRAVAALTGGQETFTRDQVAYLTALAFQMGVAAAEPQPAPAVEDMAYQAGYTDGVNDGHEGALGEVWEDLRFAFSGPRRKARRGTRGNLTAADALWWHHRAVDQRDARRAADRARPNVHDHPGGPVDWETGRPIPTQQLRSVA